MLALKQYDFSDSDDGDEESTSTPKYSPSGSSPAPGLTASTSLLEDPCKNATAGWMDSSRASGARRCEIAESAGVTAEFEVAKGVRVAAGSAVHGSNQAVESVAPAVTISMNSTPVRGILKRVKPEESDEVPLLQTVVSQGRITGRFVVKKLSPKKKLNISDTVRPVPEPPEKAASTPPVPATCGQTLEEAKGEILYKKALALAKHAGIYLPPPFSTVELPIPCKKVKLFSPEVPLKPLPSLPAQNTLDARKKPRISKRTYGLIESPSKPLMKTYWDVIPERGHTNWPPDEEISRTSEPEKVPAFQNKDSDLKKTEARLENVGAVTGDDFSASSTTISSEESPLGEAHNSRQTGLEPRHSADSSKKPAQTSGQSTVAFQLKKQEDIIKEISQNMESLKNYNAMMVDALKDVSNLLKKIAHKKNPV